MKNTVLREHTSLYVVRHSLSLSATKWAQLLGVHRTTVHRWESGDVVPSARVIEHVRLLLQQPWATEKLAASPPADVAELRARGYV
ncbi:MAG: hypothetical protein KGL39_49115 [Patescibacteria group bacterium]|nr:hypothetical protein [Patescibacteria group bacterium]